MVDRTLNKYVNEALSLKRQIEALKADFEACKGKIAGEMTERGIEEYEHGDTKVRYSKYKKRMFDKKAFEKAFPEIAERYTTTKEQTRFTIS